MHSGAIKVKSGLSTVQTNHATEAKPFLRWAGSKRKQIHRLRAFWSDARTGYGEPFAGSACLFFSLAPNSAVLGDRNQELIDLYKVVRDRPERLFRRMSRIKRSIESYTRWRSLNPKALDIETRALRLLYLNRNCFNGIYRTNNDGHFNVPMGNKLSNYFTKEDLLRCSALLQNATLVGGDFAKTLEHVRAGNLVYLDPPYAASSRRIFREYGKNTFSTTDVPRFGETLRDIAKVKATFVVSYADCREARSLAKPWNAVRLPIRRNIAGFADARRNAYEWLITNLDQIPERGLWQN